MVSAQLSLFNIGQTVATSYKIGDLVKLRKKPTAASYVKKGDIVEISAIHPVDGSIKFWNERSESWEYVYPDEIRSVVKSTDSPTMAEIAVGESNAPDDSPTIAEVAVGESNAPPGDDYLPLDPISTYRPRGTARGGEYYRLSYRSGGKVRQVHIRGGNTDSPIAQAKVQEVRSLLAIGLSPAQVAEMLRQPGKV